MQISTAAVSSSVVASPSTKPAKVAAASTSQAAVSPAVASSTSAASKTQTSAPAKAAAPAQSAQAESASTALKTLTNTTYSTSVGGKSYSGNISQSNGQYRISVPNLPGVSVSGSSLQAAENALNVKIDLLA